MYKNLSKFRLSFKLRNENDLGLKEVSDKKHKKRKNRRNWGMPIIVLQEPEPVVLPPIQAFIDTRKPIKIIKASERKMKQVLLSVS